MSKLTAAESAAFHRGVALDGRKLDPAERETLLEKYLPPDPSSKDFSPAHQQQTRGRMQRASLATKTKKAPRKKPIRAFAGSQLHLFIYNLIHLFFGIYIGLRRTYRAVIGRLLGILYYHHRTPELIQKDIKALSRLPEHLSVIIQHRPEEGPEGLVNDVAEIAAWCASARIPTLSVYERSGALKACLPQTHRTISRNLHAYFGAGASSAARPSVSLRAPHTPAFSPPEGPQSPFPAADPFRIDVLVLSEVDGRETIVDLTKTLSEMSQHGKLTSSEVTSEVIDAELSEGVMDEPDLLILFGDRVRLEGYPPWQVRLTEIFHVPDNTVGVDYQVFLRALHRYAKAQMRFGR